MSVYTSFKFSVEVLEGIMNIVTRVIKGGGAGVVLCTYSYITFLFSNVVAYWWFTIIIFIYKYFLKTLF
jgi:hypothetical protein